MFVFPVLCTWAKYLPSLGLSFLLSKIEITKYLPHKFVRTKCVPTHKVFEQYLGHNKDSGIISNYHEHFLLLLLQYCARYVPKLNFPTLILITL